MEIILGKTAGFCKGIKLALDTVSKELDRVDSIECLGDLLHNDQVIARLKEKGLKIIENIRDAKEKVIIRAHGVKKDVYEYAEKNNIELIDCTCPKLLKIHELAEKLSQKNYYVVLIGEKSHVEVQGTISFCKNGEIIENLEELKTKIDYLNTKEKIAVLTQTTYNLQKFLEIENFLKKNLKPNLKIYNSICNATEIRQEETKNISKNVDYMIIIGGRKSANTNRLHEIARENCKRTIKIEEVSELYNQNLEQINKVGIMAGASTSQKSIEEVIEYLKERE